MFAKEPEPANLLDWMEEDYPELKRNGYAGFGFAVEYLDTADMDRALQERGITDPATRRIFRRLWRAMHAERQKIIDTERARAANEAQN